jgi:hypothetical protein
MPIDDAIKRRSAGSVFPSAPGVTPSVDHDQAWRQSAGWGYYGILADDAFQEREAADLDLLQVEYFHDGAWIDVTDDLVTDPLRWTYGIDGNGPTDCVAAPGKCTFALDNSASNSVGLLGFYSPLHANCRTGWTFGVPIRIVCRYGEDEVVEGAIRYFPLLWLTNHSSTTTSSSNVVRFLGKAHEINPTPGAHMERLVRVIAYDGMYDLLEAKARQLTLQAEKTETELIEAVLDSLPVSAQPDGRDFDTGLDTLPIAFDNLGNGARALALIADVAKSSGAMYAQIGNGTHIFRNRQARGIADSQLTLDGDFVELEAPSSVSRCFNLFEVTIHPKAITDTATDVLYSLPANASINIGGGQTHEVWLDYTDPNDRQTNVGGLDVITTLVGGTHYTANTLEDGTGDDMTAFITCVVTPFASRAKYAITNNAGAPVYVTALSIVGRAVRDLGPQTYEASSVQPYGEHPLAVDMPYQSNPQVAISAATFWEAQYRSLSNQVDGVRFCANDTVLLPMAISLDIGDVITIAEDVTGVDEVRCVIHKVECEYTPDRVFWVRYGLAPTSPFDAWRPDIVGQSEAGINTIPGW